MTDMQHRAVPATPVKILAGCAALVALLVLVLLSIDRVMGHYNSKRGWADLIGPEVYRVANDRSLRHEPAVRSIILGDSVGLQMFWPGHESRPDIRYLTTNQAIGVAGQFYLLRNATAHFPALKTVCLLFTPHSWSNALQQPLVKDYFCEFFHTPSEIMQIFRLKRDPELAASQIGRWLLPNLLAANSESNLRMYSEDKAVLETNSLPGSVRNRSADAPTAEPLLSMLSRYSQKIVPALPADSSDTGHRIYVSPLSAYFLDQLRQWCSRHALQLRVIPCPCIATEVYDEHGSPYDAPLWYLPAVDFKDKIHMVQPKVASVREQFVERYGLDAG